MQRLNLLLCFTLLYLCQCSVGTSIPNKEISKINVVYKLPFLVSADSADSITDSSFIYTYKNYKVYELPTKETYYLNGEMVSDSAKRYYVGYDTASKFGFYVIRLHDDIEKRIPVDSFIKDRPNGSWIDSLVLISSLKSTSPVNSGRFFSVYIIHHPELDSLLLYYNKNYKGVDFSISKKLDSLYDSKLVKAELFIKKDTSKNAVQFNKHRKLSLEISKPVSFDNRQEILDFIKRLEEKYKQLKQAYSQ